MRVKYLYIDDHKIAVDAKGYLVNWEDWSEKVALFLADSHHIALNERHWEVIYELRQFYNQYSLSPSMRPLIHYLRENLRENLREKLPNESIDSLYLMKLFPGSPAVLAAQIAGLPRPDNCL